MAAGLPAGLQELLTFHPIEVRTGNGLRETKSLAQVHQQVRGRAGIRTLIC